MNSKEQESIRFISSGNDLYSRDLYQTCLYGTDLLESLVCEVRQLLDSEKGGFWRIFSSSGIPFDRYMERAAKLSESFPDRFRLVGDTALQYRGQNINVSFVECSKSFTILFHKDLIEMFDLPSDRFSCKIKSRYRINIKKLLELDDDISHYCSDVRKLKKWRQDPLYPVYSKHFDHLCRRFSEDTDERISISYKEGNRFLVHVMDLGIESCFPISYCRIEAERILQRIQEFNQRKMQKRKGQYQQWCDAISSYLKGDIEEYEDSSVKMGEDSYSDPNLDIVCNAISNQGRYRYSYYTLHYWEAVRLRKTCREISAAAFHQDFLNLGKYGEAHLANDETAHGQKLYISLKHIDFIYCDNTHQAVVTLKGQYLKMYPDFQKEIIYSCDISRHKGINMEILYSMDSEFDFIIQNETRNSERLAQFIRNGTVSNVAYVFDTVKPLINGIRCSRIGCINQIDIHISDSDEISIWFTLDSYYITDSSIQKTFTLEDDFRVSFRIWWHQVLLQQMHWLKSQIAGMQA